MDPQKAKALAEELNELACKGCTEGWLDNHDGLTDPIQDIKYCAEVGFITLELKQRLLREIEEIRA